MRSAELLEHLRRHLPGDEAEARCLARTRALVRWLPAPLDEHADPTHVTGSAIVLAEDHRILLHRHKRLGRWLQPGGHLDVGETPWDAAVRETLEETGLATRHPAGGPRLLHVDVHEGPRGHVHLDLRYLLHGDAEVALTPAAGESPEVAWWTTSTASHVADGSTIAAVQAAIRWATR
ncbi:MAG: NUDIX hydrolase [Actinomycetota bacterium]